VHRRGVGSLALAVVAALVAPAVPAGAADGSPRAPGPAADVSEELTGGNGVFLGEPRPVDLEDAGFVQTERAAAGTAVAYESGGPLPANGRWSLTEGPGADYRTRILVRRPARAKDFNGTVVVEWLNVSGGVDADPEFSNLSAELLREGYAWVGVSAQRIGVMGGPVLVTVEGVEGAEDVAGKGLVAIDPARYGTLSHPGDGFSFDIYTQVARALRRSKRGGVLGPLRPRRVIAAGQSQSAFALVSYINGVQPETKAFDAFFVHSRGAAPLPLVGPGESADIAGAIASTPTIIRTDNRAPVLVLQSESDVGGVLNSRLARQRDSRSFRLWEVAGTAHADAFLLGANADALVCGTPINDGPMHVVAKAGLRRLDRWVRTGTPPPKSPRLAIDEATDLIARDEDGIARGGVRTPPVDVPVVALSGQPGPNPSVICLLLGSTNPLGADQLAAHYDSRLDYRREYAADAAATIRAGFVLAADRRALRAYSDPSLVSP
jgi:hypothetical protein